MANADTFNLERSILKSLLTDSSLARIHLNSVEDSWMTSPHRKFILKCLTKYLKENQCLLTENVFTSEVLNKIPDKEQQHYINEWALISATTVSDEFPALTSLAIKEDLKRRSVDLIEEAVHLISSGNIEEAALLLRKKSVDLSKVREEEPELDITDFSDRLKKIQNKIDHPELYAGLKTGFPTFDAKSGGLFPGELTLFAALTGVGKSTFMKAIAVNVLLHAGRKVNILHITNEENKTQVAHKYDAVISGLPYSDFKWGNIARPERYNDLNNWKKTLERIKIRHGSIIIKEIPAFSTATEIERTLFELKSKGIKIDLILIDYLNNMMPVQKGWGEHDERAKVAADAKDLSIAFNVPVISALQGASVLDGKQEKGGHAGRLDVHGAKAQLHPANVFGVIMQRFDVDQEDKNSLKKNKAWQIEIKKGRDIPTFTFWAVQKVETGRVIEMSKERLEEIRNVDMANDDSVGVENTFTEDGKQKTMESMLEALTLLEEDRPEEIAPVVSDAPITAQDEPNVPPLPEPVVEVKESEKAIVGVPEAIPVVNDTVVVKKVEIPTVKVTENVVVNKATRSLADLFKKK